MEFVSTRGESEPVTFDEVVLSGLAPDGGLYVPAEIPTLPGGHQRWGYVEAVTTTLGVFGAADVHRIVHDAADCFSRAEIAPLVGVGDRLVFELFWGPTLSFKDHALQVLGGLLQRALAGADGERTVLGATSGDTGSAAIEAIRGRPGLRAVILYPEGMVSDFQRRQMTTVSDSNVVAVAVRGTFDDCQRMVKEAFRADHTLLAFNSINFARIAVQVGYYAYLGALMGAPFDVAVPTGNFGNVYACWIAKQMGVPIKRITIANNANDGLTKLITEGSMPDIAARATVAPAMDVAVPSNLERYPGDPGEDFLAGSADDDQIRETIAAVHAEHGYVLDPHTATAWKVGAATRSDLPQVVVGTAHPAKFADTVRASLGWAPPPPPGFEDLELRPERLTTIEADPSALAALIR